MRILTRADFMQCPVGTVFFDVLDNSHIMQNLSVKTSGSEPAYYGDGRLNDFYRIDVDSALNLAKAGATQSCSSSNEAFDLFERALGGEPVSMHFDRGGRDGAFEQDALFAVLDEADVDRLIQILLLGRRSTPEDP